MYCEMQNLTSRTERASKIHAATELAELHHREMFRLAVHSPEPSAPVTPEQSRRRRPLGNLSNGRLQVGGIKKKAPGTPTVLHLSPLSQENDPALLAKSTCSSAPTGD